MGCFCSSLFADSPLTSTNIHLGYKNEPIVIEALEKSGLTENILMYLASPSNPIAIKIAVINALGWEMGGHTYSDVFFRYLQKERKYKNMDKFTKKASGELIICMAYLKALGNYFEVDDAILLAQKAKKNNPKSYTVNIVGALIEAQKAMDDDWCEVYEITNRVRENKALIDDMNEDAKNEIFNYMDLYACGSQ